jgi:DNA ligase-1
MKYSKLVELYEYLEQTPSRLKKVEAIADFFRSADSSVLDSVALLVQGKVFPPYSEKEMGKSGLNKASLPPFPFSFQPFQPPL